MQNEGIYCLDEWQKDRMRHGGGRVNSLGGCFNELISHLLRMKREKKMLYDVLELLYLIKLFNIRDERDLN